MRDRARYLARTVGHALFGVPLPDYFYLSQWGEVERVKASEGEGESSTLELFS